MTRGRKSTREGVGEGVIVRHRPSGFSGNDSSCQQVEPEIEIREGVPEWREYWVLPESDLGIDLNFLGKQYGFHTCSHLPLDRMGRVRNKVGVQIGINLDLSEWTATELRSLHLNEGTLRKVAPYCQRKGQQALEVVTKRGHLKLTPEEAMQLQTACSRQLVAIIKDLYDTATQGRSLLKTWEELRVAERTVIYDILTKCRIKTVNRGVNDCSLFWSQVTEQNWNNSVSCLRDLMRTPSSRARQKTRPISRESVRLLETSTADDSRYLISPLGRVLTPENRAYRTMKRSRTARRNSYIRPSSIMSYTPKSTRTNSPDNFATSSPGRATSSLASSRLLHQLMDNKNDTKSTSDYSFLTAN